MGIGGFGGAGVEDVGGFLRGLGGVLTGLFRGFPEGLRIHDCVAGFRLD